MLTKVLSCAVIGLDGAAITIEVDVSMGHPQCIMVGLPDKAVDESRQRIRTAIRNSGLEYPWTRRIVVNLAPADIKKEGASFDLPIAIGVLASSGQIKNTIEDSIFVGELALDGGLRPIKGILPVAIWAHENDINTIYVPVQNSKEALIVEGLNVIPVSTLKQLVAHINKVQQIDQSKLSQNSEHVEDLHEVDMSDISGHNHAKRALEIAVAGGHNIAMTGPPGSGKTLLSKAMVTILPEMTQREKLEVTKIYSIAGRLDIETPLINIRPFRSPHHTASNVALVGGGVIPRPGEISLSHRGVLFLDEFAEFTREVLESLRQPLEDGVVTISRAHGSFSFPSRFTLVASKNPCPCGYYDDKDRNCVCTQSQIIQYQNRISGPIMDRIDLHVDVPRLSYENMTYKQKNEPSSSIRERVNSARLIQEKRFKGHNILTNSEMNASHVRKMISLNSETQELMKQAVNTMHLSARSFHRILKLARTIADLSNEQEISSANLAEALQYRPTNE